MLRLVRRSVTNCCDLLRVQLPRILIPRTWVNKGPQECLAARLIADSSPLLQCRQGRHKRHRLGGRMDAFITTVLAGIIVAVVGAIVAYYFGGVREKRKQEYDRQKEEQIRQEERQKDQNKRRIEAVDGLRSRAPTRLPRAFGHGSIGRLPKRRMCPSPWPRIPRMVTRWNRR
jgi:hypothetical protein